MQPGVKIIVDNDYLEQEIRRRVDERLEAILTDMGIGTWWDMGRLKYETSRGYDWLTKYIIYDHRVRDFAKQKNSQWLFKAPEMKAFLNTFYDEL
ncbi:DUF771 domain-containing protein [Bacillus thuringiensis]|uniref:DUF771 domain-containing protein n=1 Tax=Bacillus thuringiensis TaxID=1428 RepID=A0A9X6YCU1_BACTU|nr:DUF771 domain-containing protein [Bacillus thuringiensis]PEA91969.1 hypothetical protein CON71_00485 [Bacillus thuringiensis]